MNIIPINEAKAIIEPYYNNDKSLYTIDTHPVLKQYQFKSFTDNLTIKSTWSSLLINIKKGNPGKELVTMERKCLLHLENYDHFILFASISDNVQITFEAIIDGEKKQWLHHKSGFNTTGELKIPFKGKCVTYVKFSFSIIKDQECNIEIRWLGVGDSKREGLVEKNRFFADANWIECIKKEKTVKTPLYGLYFNKEELSTIRETIKKSPFKESFDKLRQAAHKYVSLDPDYAETHIHSTKGEAIKKENMIPENMISKYVPWGDRRWNLNSEMRYCRINEHMEVLAFVGLIDKNPKMSHMAVRMALSIAHCENWTESPMGNLPGVVWHHRSFTEAAYVRACSLVLDWAGELLTDYGKEIILDAIIMKGLPRIESDFKRVEYIRHMNQGIHFNGARIHAYGILSKVWPRYEEMLHQCKKDLFEMIDHYVLEDGGALEGPAYWNYTFSQAMQEAYLLSVYYKKELDEIASDKLIKTGDYGIAMLSLLHNGTMLLPVNDSHSEKNYHLGMTACFYLLTKSEQWKKLYFRMIAGEFVEPDPFLFIVSSRIKNDSIVDATMDEWFHVLKETGQVDIRKKHSDLGMIHVHYATGPSYVGHFHGDKGSFLLEVNEESLLIDRGVTPYSHPATHSMQLTKNHNCLVPYDEDMVFYTQVSTKEGGVLKEASHHQSLHICSDDTKAWEEGAFLSCKRKITSEKATEYVITDTGKVGPLVKGVSFRLHTHKSVVKEKDGYTIVGDKTNVKVIPMNYSLDDSGFSQDGIDGEERDVHTIWMNQEIQEEYHLQTKLIIMKK